MSARSSHATPSSAGLDNWVPAMGTCAVTGDGSTCGRSVGTPHLRALLGKRQGWRPKWALPQPLWHHLPSHGSVWHTGEIWTCVCCHVHVGLCVLRTCVHNRQSLSKVQQARPATLLLSRAHQVVRAHLYPCLYHNLARFHFLTCRPQGLGVLPKHCGALMGCALLLSLSLNVARDALPKQYARYAATYCYVLCAFCCCLWVTVVTPCLLHVVCMCMSVL